MLVKRFYVLSFGILLACAAPARAEVLLGYTSFEEPVVPANPSQPGVYADRYTDPASAAVNHPLVNVSGFNVPVNYTSVGGELGFSAYYTNSRNSYGLTQSGSTGVVRNHTGFHPLNPKPTDGAQQYAIASANGRVTVTLDSVDLTGAVDPVLSLDFALRSTQYFVPDYQRIWLEINNGGSISEINLLDGRGVDPDTLGIEKWNHVSLALPTGTIATLKFENDTTDSANNKMLALDNVRFTATAVVPEPGTIVIGSIGALALSFVGLRRRVYKKR